MEIMKLFKKQEQAVLNHEQIIVQKIIEALQIKPEDFSAKWFSGKSLDKSVQHKNKELLIMINTGDIIAPIEPKMTNKQKETVKKLLTPIVKRDSDEIIKNFTL